MMQVNVKALRAALKPIKAVVEARNTVPILSHVMVQSTPGQAFLTSTDLDVMVAKTIDLEDAGSNKTMAFCVDASTLASIAAKLPADGIASIDKDEASAGGIIVKCGRSRFKLPTLPTDDFPTMVRGDWDAEWEQDASALTRMIESVRFAISTEETRYYLNGIFLHVPADSECQFAAATDGNRLARYHVPLPDGAGGMPGVIISRKTVKALAELLDEEGGTVGICVSKGKVSFEVGTTVLTAKTIDGTFPDYTRVIPAANTIDAWFEPGPLAEAVERVLTISSEKTKLIRFDWQADQVTLNVSSPEHGTASEDVPCDLTGAALTIGFNGGFLLDILRQLKGMGSEGAKARVLMADAAAPTLWQTSDEAAALFVLMPMRV